MSILPIFDIAPTIAQFLDDVDKVALARALYQDDLLLQSRFLTLVAAKQYPHHAAILWQLHQISNMAEHCYVRLAQLEKTLLSKNDISTILLLNKSKIPWPQALQNWVHAAQNRPRYYWTFPISMAFVEYVCLRLNVERYYGIFNIVASIFEQKLGLGPNPNSKFLDSMTTDVYEAYRPLVMLEYKKEKGQR